MFKRRVVDVSNEYIKELAELGETLKHVHKLGRVQFTRFGGDVVPTGDTLRALQRLLALAKRVSNEKRKSP